MSWRGLSLGLVGLAAAAVGLMTVQPFGTQETTLARIRRSGVIRIGYAVEPPYAYLDARGRLTGLEVEVARVVVSRLALPRAEWLLTEFGSLIPDLEAGRFDAVAAGMFITPDRARRVDFSEPTFRVQQSLLVKAGNPHDLHAYEDVSKQPGVKLAVLPGSIEEALVQAAGVPRSQVVVVPDALTGRVAVEAGLVAGLALSTPTIRFMAREQALGVTEAAEPFAAPARSGAGVVGYGAVVFAKGSDDLRAAWNRELTNLVGGPDHRRLLAQFGLTDDELPGDQTTAGVLAAGERGRR